MARWSRGVRYLIAHLRNVPAAGDIPVPANVQLVFDTGMPYRHFAISPIEDQRVGVLYAPVAVAPVGREPVLFVQTHRPAVSVSDPRERKGIWTYVAIGAAPGASGLVAVRNQPIVDPANPVVFPILRFWGPPGTSFHVRGGDTAPAGAAPGFVWQHVGAAGTCIVTGPWFTPYGEQLEVRHLVANQSFTCSVFVFETMEESP